MTEEASAKATYCKISGNCFQFHLSYNAIELNAALNALAKEGLIPSLDELAALSPYQTRHLKRFGNYELDLSAIAEPLTDDLTFEIEPPQEATPIEANQNALVLSKES